MADLPGKAVHDFYFNKSRKKLFVQDVFGPKDEMPLPVYFRGYSEMPVLEKKALEVCSGKILDIGAGAGSHALELQKKFDEVYALEISPSACEVMKNRGVQQIICEDVFNYKAEKFDTLLLLMNGIGLCATLTGFKKFLGHAEDLLNPNGQLIFDSCDISYMFEDTAKPDYYYGQVKCRYEYGGLFTDWFEWLYLDQQTMSKIAAECGWNAKIILEDENDQYLAVLTKIR